MVGFPRMLCRRVSFCLVVRLSYIIVLALPERRSVDYRGAARSPSLGGYTWSRQLGVMLVYVGALSQLSFLRLLLIFPAIALHGVFYSYPFLLSTQGKRRKTCTECHLSHSIRGCPLLPLSLGLFSWKRGRGRKRKNIRVLKLSLVV